MFSAIDQLTTVVSGAPIPFMQKFEPVSSSLYFHLVMGTGGAPLNEEDEANLKRYMTCFIRKSGGRINLVSFAQNRVHILVGLSPNCALGTFVRELKLISATYATRRLGLENFGWTEKYDAFTVSLSQIDRVCSYIRRQKWLTEQESYASSWNRLASQEIY